MSTYKTEKIPSDVKNGVREAIAIAGRFLRTSHPPGQGVGRSRLPSSPAAVQDLIADLTQTLYSQWYISGSSPKPPGAEDHPPNWIEVLRTAHTGSYRWEDHWRAVKVSTAGRVLAKKGCEERLLATMSYISLDRPGLPPLPGGTIRAVSRRDSIRISPGFWVTWARTWRPSMKPLIRLYWNVFADGAPLLVQHITKKMDDDLPYCLKMPSSRADYDRVDTAVLYVLADEWKMLAPIVREVHSVLAHHLAPQVPKLTKKLGDGLGLAEDPMSAGESFGLHRCRLIAEGILRAATTGARKEQSVLKIISDRFQETGISLQRPYLNRTAESDYEF